MPIKPLNHDALYLMPEQIPQFKEEQLGFLSVRMKSDFPEKMNTLRDRVQNFQQQAGTLNARIKSHNNISLVRLIGTVILVAGGSLGLICGSLPVGISLLGASFLLMSLGTLYLYRADAQLSTTVTEAHAEGDALDQELDSACAFWNAQGSRLLSQAQKIMIVDSSDEQQHLIQEIQNGIDLASSLRTENEV